MLGVGLLQVVLDKGNDLDWFASSQIVVMSTISAISLVSFVIWELGERHPIVNLRLFKDRNFAIGTLSLGYAAFFAINIILPQWLQTQMGYTAIWAGLAAAPMGILPLMMTPIIGRYANKFDLRIRPRSHFDDGGLLPDSRAVQYRRRFPHHCRSAAIYGDRRGVFLHAHYHDCAVKPERRGSGRRLRAGDLFRVLGGSFASSLTTWIWSRREVFHHANLTESVSAYNPARWTISTRWAAPRSSIWR